MDTLRPCPTRRRPPRAAMGVTAGQRPTQRAVSGPVASLLHPAPPQRATAPWDHSLLSTRWLCGQLRVPAHTFHVFQKEPKVCTVTSGRSAQQLG